VNLSQVGNIKAVQALIPRALAAFCFVIIFSAALTRPLYAEQPTASESIPPQVKALNELLADPVVADWLKKQISAEPSETDNRGMMMISSDMDSRVASARERLRAIAAGAPKFPSELAGIVLQVKDEITPRAPGVVPLVLLFLLLGFGSQWLVKSLSISMPTKTFKKYIIDCMLYGSEHFSTFWSSWHLRLEVLGCSYCLPGRPSFVA